MVTSEVVLSLSVMYSYLGVSALLCYKLFFLAHFQESTKMERRLGGHHTLLCCSQVLLSLCCFFLFLLYPFMGFRPSGRVVDVSSINITILLDQDYKYSNVL